MRINNLQYLKERRRNLRNNPTKSEKFFWKFLANRKLNGYKFRRQHSLNHFIVDFYCPELKLIIEVDGEIHNRPEQHEKDLFRDNELRKLGFQILRYTNYEVEHKTDSVLERIKDFISTIN